MVYTGVERPVSLCPVTPGQPQPVIPAAVCAAPQGRVHKTCIDIMGVNIWTKYVYIYVFAHECIYPVFMSISVYYVDICVMYAHKHTKFQPQCY